MDPTRVTLENNYMTHHSALTKKEKKENNRKQSVCVRHLPRQLLLYPFYIPTQHIETALIYFFNKTTIPDLFTERERMKFTETRFILVFSANPIQM